MIGRSGGAIPLHAGLDADARDEAVGRWVLASWTAPRSGRPLYSVDGKRCEAPDWPPSRYAQGSGKVAI